MEKTFNGKAIYNPSGKAGEYSEWACNFYVGCSNGCTYCYLKKGRGAAVLGGDKPTLKKCFRDEDHALEVFEKELMANLPELKKHGLFFSFTTDPMLDETLQLTMWAANYAVENFVPVKILTKRADWVDGYLHFLDNSNSDNAKRDWRGRIAFGFTLTGRDDQEPGASPNIDRIRAFPKLHDAGFKTFASIEPVIDFESSYEMIWLANGYCDLYKIGLLSGQKTDRTFYEELRTFNLRVVNLLARTNSPAKVYWKESVQKHFDVFPDAGCNVGRDYNMFEER